MRLFFDLRKFRTNYTCYVFDLFKQKHHIANQPIRLELKFRAAIEVEDYIAYALVHTPQIISSSSDGQ